MKVKGFLQICAGIIGGNILTFSDTQVSPKVSLYQLTSDSILMGYSSCDGCANFETLHDEEGNLLVEEF